jgi:type I restriction enzyme M protein
MLSNTLKSKVNNLWDKFWSSGISNPISAIEQISYLLFMKRLDESDKKRQHESGNDGQKHDSIFKGSIGVGGKKLEDSNDGKAIDKATLRWSYLSETLKNNKDKEDDLLRHVQTNVFPFIQQLGNINDPFAKHMANAVFLIPKASLLVEAIRAIDDIYNEIERQQNEGQTFQDNLGDLYEYLLNEIS